MVYNTILDRLRFWMFFAPSKKRKEEKVLAYNEYNVLQLHRILRIWCVTIKLATRGEGGRKGSLTLRRGGGKEGIRLMHIKWLLAFLGEQRHEKERSQKDFYG